MSSIDDRLGIVLKTIEYLRGDVDVGFFEECIPSIRESLAKFSVHISNLFSKYLADSLRFNYDSSETVPIHNLKRKWSDVCDIIRILAAEYSQTKGFERYAQICVQFKPQLFAELLKSKKCKDLAEICEIASLDLPKGYKPIRKLGKGGSGSVYLVENTVDGLEEAIKILDTAHNKGSPEDIRHAIESELKVRRLNKLRCPYITMYYSVSYYRRHHIIFMEPFEKTLEDRLVEAKGPLPLKEALVYYKQLCEALATCHVNGIVHKDLAPHNIGIDAEGNIKLSDFGDPLTTIEKKSKQSPLDYSSPRQLALSENDLEVLPSDNVWSLGVIAYEMVTGEKPFSSKDLERSERSLRKKYIKERHKEINDWRSLFKFINNALENLQISPEYAMTLVGNGPDPVYTVKATLHQMLEVPFKTSDDKIQLDSAFHLKKYLVFNFLNIY